jgi:hypothetical protein
MQNCHGLVTASYITVGHAFTPGGGCMLFHGVYGGEEANFLLYPGSRAEGCFQRQNKRSDGSNYLGGNPLCDSRLSVYLLFFTRASIPLNAGLVLSR